MSRAVVLVVGCWCDGRLSGDAGGIGLSQGIGLVRVRACVCVCRGRQ